MSRSSFWWRDSWFANKMPRRDRMVGSSILRMPSKSLVCYMDQRYKKCWNGRITPRGRSYALNRLHQGWFELVGKFKLSSRTIPHPQTTDPDGRNDLQLCPLLDHSLIFVPQTKHNLWTDLNKQSVVNKKQSILTASMDSVRYLARRSVPDCCSSNTNLNASAFCFISCSRVS